MPWCPKCKTEYRKGFTVCADCGSELVEEQPLEERKGALPEEAMEADIPGVETAGTWEGVLSGDAAEKGPEESGGPEDNGEIAEARPLRRGGGPYRDSSERASDNRSSAWILLILGVLGLAVLILGVTEVIPLKLGNSYLFYGVMGAVFILFVVSGAVSMKNAKFFERKAESENSLRSTLLDWCRENLDGAEIDGRVGAQGVSEEVMYFRRTSYIKEKLNHQFMNLDQEFLDSFIDEYVYELVFEGKSE